MREGSSLFTTGVNMKSEPKTSSKFPFSFSFYVVADVVAASAVVLLVLFVISIIVGFIQPLGDLCISSVVILVFNSAAVVFSFCFSFVCLFVPFFFFLCA